MKNKVKNYKLKTTIMLVICLIVLFSIFLVNNDIKKEDIISSSEKIEVYPYNAKKDEDEVYLSDIDYLPGRNQSFPGWDQIRYDEVNGGGKITLKIEGGAFAFEKGIWAHATSQITYDISEYNYKYFTSYIGLNTTSTAGNGVKFKIYTSADGTNWGEPSVYTKTPGQEATFIKIDLEGVNYLRLYADSNGSNAADHSVYGDAKLTNNANPTLAFGTKEDYDEKIKEKYTNNGNITEELEFDILKRQFINNVGSFTLTAFYNASEDNKEAIDFLMTNQKALKYYILGGKPSVNNYYKSLTEFSRLYKNYKEDFNNTEVTKYGTVLGDLYIRMAVSLSLTHTHRVGLWINNSSNSYNQSDSVRRYAIYKYMHKNGLLKGVAGADLAEWFEDYTVEEMRYVMATSIDDESILWLNAYTQELIDKYGSRYLTPHPYIAYVTPNDDPESVN